MFGLEIINSVVFTRSVALDLTNRRVKKGLLTSRQIIEIRKLYGLTQSELSNLLGWGEATVSRYESKSIQDETYDNILRLIKQSPMEALKFLEKSKSKFSSLKYLGIRSKIVENLDEYGREYLKKQELESEYVNYQETSDFNGNKCLDIEKLENIVAYFALNVHGLYKVKLMKLLWYADALFFQKYETSITGLVYTHMTMGALPVAHYKILELEAIKYQEEFDANFNSSYKILPNEKLNLSILSQKELDVLSQVATKFRDFNGKEIADCMHQEKAYIETNENQIIPYSLAKQIRDF